MGNKILTKLMTSLKMQRLNKAITPLSQKSMLSKIAKNDEFLLEKPKFTCAICGKKFSDKNCLKKHILRIHRVDAGPLLPNEKSAKNNVVPFKCRVCETEFAYKRNLKRHLLKYHSQGLEDEEGGNCFCNVEGCKFRSFFISALRTHLGEEHKVYIEIENKVFSSKKEFEEWKEEEEKTNVCLFIKEAGKHTLINGDQRLIYQCHRSGHYSGHGFGKRSFRVKGTCKLGKRCTAGIELTLKGYCDTHEVVYYKTHIWHQPDVLHVNLSVSERTYLAEKLKEGASITSILESVKANKSEEGNNFCKRIQLLKRKDLVNIENTFRLNNTERHIKKQHKKAEKIDHEKIKKNTDDFGDIISWVIESACNPNEFITVKQVQSEKCMQQCGVICPSCNVCLHMYCCTCHDYLLFGTMCLHIHAVSLSLSSSCKCKKNYETTKRRSKEKESEHESIKSMLSNEDNKNDMDILEVQRQQALQTARNKLRERVQVLGDLCSLKLHEINETCITMMMKIIDSAINIINPAASSVITPAVSVLTTPISENMFHHMQSQPTILQNNNAMLSNNQCSTIRNQQYHSEMVNKNVINDLGMLNSEDRKFETLPQYCCSARNKKRNVEENTQTSLSFARTHVFDKRGVFCDTNLNDNTLIHDSYSSCECNAMSWQTVPVLSSTNSSLVGKWWPT